jgi:hypothetical protein
MTARDPAPLSSYDFFAWLTVTRPPLMEGLFGAPYGVATREVADRVGFRPAGAAETIGHYLAALQAFIAAPPPVPAPAPLPVDFAGPEPVRAPWLVTEAVGDPLPRHLFMRGVEWPAPLDFHEVLGGAGLRGLYGPTIVEAIVDHWDRLPATAAPMPPFTLPFDTVAEPPRSALSRVLAAVYLAASVRLRSVFSTTTTSPP